MHSDQNKKVGLGLLLLSCFLSTLGVLLIFDRTMLIFANICFVGGLYFLIGAKRTISFFKKKGRMKGSVMFFGGFLLILFISSFLGFVMQLVGLVYVFKDFLPFLYDSTYSIPIIGKYIRSFLEMISKQRRNPV